MSRLNRGFTLIEILVALVIFAVMSGMAYRGLSSVLEARERVAEEYRKWRELTGFFARLENDFTSLVNRSVRDSNDLKVEAFRGRTDVIRDTDAALTFTRAGLPGTTGALAGPQRFGYRLRDKAVEQLIWPVLDQAPRTVPAVYKILQNVDEFGFRYLDANKQWRDTWPAPGAQDAVLPRAVEVMLTLSTGEKINRLFALP